MRVDKVGDQFGIQYVILGGGDEYERINDIKGTNATYIIPLDLPKAYDVENPFLASTLELENMREWNQMPSNPKALADNNVSFAFTTHDLKSPSALKSNLMKAIKYGLDKSTALEALTTIPAKILGKSNSLGSLKNGAYANFLITSGDIFESKTTLYENWVKGHRNILESMSVKDLSGEYDLKVGGASYNLTISGSPSKPKASVKNDTNEFGSKISYSDDWLNLMVRSTDTTTQSFMRLVSKIGSSDNLNGKVIYPNGSESTFYATKKVKDKSEAMNGKGRNGKGKTEVKMMPVTFPNGAYGFSQMPRQETILFKNATVWTNESEGILTNTDVLVKNGKISAIGSNLNSSGAKVIDATGKHLTAGIVDEHSHIAASSINEAGHNSSAEVTIKDAIDPEDIEIYRNLAGGVTSIQILHGSANPIGGRSAIIKLKWGESADNMINKNAPGFIKFALGENVKQSNWQSFERFPQTRMGVEQLYVDYFSRAREYEALKNSGKSYRKDIEMEVLSDVLNKNVFISCHF